MPMRMNKPIGTIAYLGGLPAVLEPFCWAWGQMVQFNQEYLVNPGETVWYDRATVSLHPYARNELARRFLGDWLLQLDTDHEFEPDLALRMVVLFDQIGADVLSGVYLMKTHPHVPVLYNWNADGSLAPIADWDRSVSAVEIGSSGGGCLLVRRRVFERIASELKEDPFELIKPFGEDHSFYHRLKRLGIKAYAATAIESPHLHLEKVTVAGHRRKVPGWEIRRQPSMGYR
jgi:hypothetical protein